MKPYTEEDVEQAIEAIVNGQSLRKASLEWGVPRTTLSDRLTGTKPWKQAFSGLQKLSPSQEDHLAQWVLTQDALGLPPSHLQVKQFAERILQAKGDSRPLGKRWIRSFLARYPAIKVRRSKSMDSKRVNGASTDIIKTWFRYLNIPAIKAIKSANRYNMDESGIMEGKGSNGLVLGSSQKKAIRKKEPGSRAWISFVECISATGKFLPPLVIYRGQSVQQQWFPLDLAPYASWKFTSTNKGWITDATALEWLEKIFIPNTQPEDPSEYRLLILDGHGSHETTDFMWLCYQHKIHLLFLPPHSSHVLQPLDLSIFSPLKTAYRKELGFLSQWTDSTVVGKRNFLTCYRVARQAALTEQNIKSGWKATGLWPVSMTKPLMNPLVLDNSNQATTVGNSGLLEGFGRKDISNWDLDTSAVVWSTPKKADDLKDQLGLFNKLEQSTTTQRLLFQKVRKAFDEKDVQLAVAQRKIESLEAKVEAVRPRKRKKVDLSPNSKFADIEAIYRVQKEVGEAGPTLDESDGSDLPSEPGSCIVIG